MSGDIFLASPAGGDGMGLIIVPYRRQSPVTKDYWAPNVSIAQVEVQPRVPSWLLPPDRLVQDS